MTPTVEPAGVSEERLSKAPPFPPEVQVSAALAQASKALDVLLTMLRKAAPQGASVADEINGEVKCAQKNYQTVILELLAARQQLAAREAECRVKERALTAFSQQLAEMRAERDSALSIACPECVKAYAALAPTSQPSREKCRRCGGSGALRTPQTSPLDSCGTMQCPDCKSTGDCAQPERQGATPFDQLKAAMQADDAYAWSWHCNIAMPMLDAKQGLTHQQANECAAAVMEHIFRIDVRKSREWQATFKQPDAERPSPPQDDIVAGLLPRIDSVLKNHPRPLPVELLEDCRRTIAALGEKGWISVSERLPKCSKKLDSFGVQVLIYPPYESEGSSPAHTAFYGRRITNEPGFYLYGRCINVTHWRELPSPPVSGGK